MPIKIIYKGTPNELLDKKISRVLGPNFIWYAQGYDFEKDERDLCFDIKIKGIE